MLLEAVAVKLREFSAQIVKLNDAQSLCDFAAEFIAGEVKPDCIFLYYSIDNLKIHTRIESKLAKVDVYDWEPIYDPFVTSADEITLPLYINDLQRNVIPLPLQPRIRADLKSLAIWGIERGTLVSGAIELHFGDAYHRWRREELFLIEQLSQLLAVALERFSTSTAAITDNSAEYERVAEYGNLLIVRTDRELRITSVFGSTERITGIKLNDFLNDSDIWMRVIYPQDLVKLSRKIARMRLSPSEISEEIRILHQESGALRWILLRAIPLYDKGRNFIGWEGFGLDITDRYEAQQGLKAQSKRVEALYQISRALQFTMDPALVVLKGLKSLIKATNSDAGIGLFYDRNSEMLELVAAEGLSQQYVAAVNKVINGPSLVRYAIDNREGILLDNIQQDSRAAVEVAKIEDLKSTIVMPLMIDQTVLGALVLFCRKASRYSNADFELVEAAANQVVLVCKQADFYAAEKRQASSLAALYRLSHELAKHTATKEIAESAFPVIQEEFGCKRIWFGVINDQGTHIVGQAGYGPGIRQSIIDVQIELDLRHDFLDDAIKSKKPVIVKPGEPMECSGLARIMKKLKPGTFIIVPLISLGQVMGILVVEPSVPSNFFAQSKLPLLRSMASEIANVILARRFEYRMAEADKMRMAGMLASGVAHNFNNMLQAVMGQASLIEMQLPEDSMLRPSAKMIVEAAHRGALLIKQLLSFSRAESVSCVPISLKKMLLDSNDFYRSVLGSAVALNVEIGEDVPEVKADYNQLQQVIANILVNAKEAINFKTDGKVDLSLKRVRLLSGEVDPELPPGVYVRLDISDNGAGMDAERQRRCFEPFFTTKNTDSGSGVGISGSGLGLSTAYSIIRQHDGMLTVRSSPGQGSVFSLLIPALVAIKESAKTEQTKYEALDVMIFDLDDSTSLSVKSALESIGLNSAIYSDREDLFKTVKESSKVSLLIFDAERYGYEFEEMISKIRAMKPELKILISALNYTRWQRIFGHLEGIEIIEKPIGVWAVHSAAKRLLGRNNATQKLVQAIEKEKINTELNLSGESQENNDTLLYGSKL